MTIVGQINIIWFDGSWERTPEQWQAEELAKMIRELQPNILINDRLPNCEDFETAEQSIKVGDITQAIVILSPLAS